ncbi:MAG: S1 RNA-binding domain-containing protein [Patescibacteria group bacterium]
MPIVNAVKNESLNRLIKNEPQLAAVLRTGDLAKGRILSKTSKAVFVDLGRYGTGVIYGLELLNAKNMLKSMAIGDELTAKVAEAENEQGYTELSLTAASKQKSWDEIKELKEKDEVLKVKISGYNSGGLMAEIRQLQAFLPVSQLASDHYPRVTDGDKAKIIEELKKLVGSELNVKIIDLNFRTNKLIISEREASEEGIKSLLKNYEAGQIIDGIVSGVADFGAFVKFADNTKVEGLIHLSELDHRLINNPKEVLKVDEPVKVKIIEIKDGRVSLSLKALKPDPWLKVEEKYKAGETVTGTVYKFNPFGAFINLDAEIQGLIHISEFGGMEEMKSKLSVGQSYKFTIDSVKPEEKRLILKLKS